MGNGSFRQLLRARARAWNMEAFFETLWNNAFQAGYREGKRENGSTQNHS